MKRILIVKTSALGDIVHSYPVISYLKYKFPDILIDWVVEKNCASLVETHPEINKVLCISSKEWRRAPFSMQTWQAIRDFRKDLRMHTYDAVFDLQGNIKSGLIVSQTLSPKKVGYGKKSVAEWPNVLFTKMRFDIPKGQTIREDYLALISAFCSESDAAEKEFLKPLHLNMKETEAIELKALLSQYPHNKPCVIVSPGSAWPNKQLKVEILASFLKKVHQKMNCFFLFLWGSQSENQAVSYLHEQLPDCSHIVSKMPLSMVQNLMKEASLVIAMDSLPLHLAGTTSVATFSIFGPSSAQKYKPHGSNHYAFQGSCPYGRVFEKRCPILRTCTTGACMHHITAEELFLHFTNWQKIHTLSANGIKL